SVAHRPFDDYGHQKQAALELTTGEWVLSIDADERVTPELAQAIKAAIATPTAADGYWVRRDLLYLGVPLRFGGTGRDWILRVARRSKTRFALLPVHEHLIVDGSTARLPGTLHHIKYRRLAEHVAQMNSYTDLSAARRVEAGKWFSGWHLLRIPWELFARLVLRLGLLDGRPGIIWASMAAFYSFLKVAKMWRPDDR
ncbi:MAG TPA: glycosyltransferase family 2 protein, partial [Gemmatimonadaceae bacterium]|nr:glycosyltransferase family 2 protein [Gemmatimonadaceae bacterium]